MTDDNTTDDNTTDDVPPEFSIEDFITGYTGKAWVENGIAILAHNGDGITITVPPEFSKIIVRQKTTEKKITRNPGIWPMPGGDSVENIIHADTVHTITSTPEATGGIEPFTAGSKTFVNNAEKTETKTVGLYKVEIIHDWNHYFSLDNVYDLDGNKLKIVKYKPPAPPDPNAKKPFDWNALTPWIVGAIVVLIIAAVVYWFFLRGRTIAGYTFGKPAPAPAPVQSAPSVVVVPTTAPAPAPAPAPVPTAPGGK